MTTTIAEIIKQAPQLASESPEVDVELLLLHVIKQPRSYLFSYPEYCLTPTELQQFSQLLKDMENQFIDLPFYTDVCCL